MGKKNEISWDVSKAFLDKVLDSVSATGWDFNSLLNVNFPQCNVNEVNGIEVTSQGNRETDDLVLWKKENNLFRIGLQRRLGESSKPKNNILNKPIDGVMTDVVALTSNKISITPLHLDLTHAASIEILRKSLKLKQT